MGTNDEADEDGLVTTTGSSSSPEENLGISDEEDPVAADRLVFRDFLGVEYELSSSITGSRGEEDTELLRRIISPQPTNGHVLSVEVSSFL